MIGDVGRVLQAILGREPVRTGGEGLEVCPCFGVNPEVASLGSLSAQGRDTLGDLAETLSFESRVWAKTASSSGTCIVTKELLCRCEEP